jgi:hypothetical protein
MTRGLMLTALLAATVLGGGRYACAGQVPGASAAPDIAISHRDRVYSAEQFSNTVSVTDLVCRQVSVRSTGASYWSRSGIFARK